MGVFRGIHMGAVFCVVLEDAWPGVGHSVSDARRLLVRGLRTLLLGHAGARSIKAATTLSTYYNSAELSDVAVCPRIVLVLFAAVWGRPYLIWTINTPCGHLVGVFSSQNGVLLWKYGGGPSVVPVWARPAYGHCSESRMTWLFCSLCVRRKHRH